jgi:hypothetical protein
MKRDHSIRLRSCLIAAALAIGAVAAGAQTPARDTPAVATRGTSVINGTIVTATDQRPLRGVLVVVGGGPEQRSAITDDKGRFAVRDLLAGRYSVSATKPAYLWQTFGATRIGGPGVTIVLADGQTTDASMALTRGGVISGMLTNGKGRPIHGMTVVATTVPASGQWAAVASLARPPVMTDAAGAYRLFGLAPGDYIVVGLLPSPVRGTIERRSTKDVDDLLAKLAAKRPGEPVEAPSVSKGAAPPVQPPPAGAFAPVFYPGTANWHSATLVHIDGSDERSGVDFSVVASPMLTLDGAVQGPVSDLSKVELSLIIDSPQFGFNYGARPVLVQPPNAEGKFRYENVTPGHYTVTARGLPAGVTSTERLNTSGGALITDGGVPRDASDYLYGLTDVDVAPGSNASIAVTLAPGGTIRGRFVIENGSGAKDPDLSAARLRIVAGQPISTSASDNTQIGNGFMSPGVSAPQADGSVAIRGIFPGDFTFGFYFPPELSKTWWLRAAMSNGRDLLDAPFSIRAGDDISDVQFVLTDRHTELKGKLNTAGGRPAPDFFVIVIPEDPSLWVPKSRRVRTTRPATDGAFSFADLPAGNYLVGALTDVTEKDWNDPKFLAALAPAAVKVTIALGQVAVQDLRIGGGAPY